MSSPKTGHAIPRGVYTSKTRGPEIAYGSDGKPIAYAPSPYVPAYATASKRDALKGKQMSVPFSSKGFGKIDYVPSPYEDKSAKKTAGKLGFCSSKPFGRDDVSRYVRPKPVVFRCFHYHTERASCCYLCLLHL